MQTTHTPAPAVPETFEGAINEGLARENARLRSLLGLNGPALPSEAFAIGASLDGEALEQGEVL